MRDSKATAQNALLIRTTPDRLLQFLVVFLVSLSDPVYLFPEPFAIVPYEIRSLQDLCAPRRALRSGICRDISFFTSRQKQYSRETDAQYGKKAMLHGPNKDDIRQQCV